MSRKREPVPQFAIGRADQSPRQNTTLK